MLPKRLKHLFQPQRLPLLEYEDFTIWRRNGNEKVINNNTRRQNNNLCMCISLFCTFVCRLIFARKRLETAQFYFLGRTLKSYDEIFFSLLTWIWFLEIQLREGSPTFRQSKWVGIIAIKKEKTERTQIHFWSDVFAAVASSNRKVPYEEWVPFEFSPSLQGSQ